MSLFDGQPDSLDDYKSSLDEMTNQIYSQLHSGSGNSQQQWEANVTAKTQPAQNKISGTQYFNLTKALGSPRIDAGIGTGDIAQKDATGRITGYTTNPTRNAGGLTPGLDRLHAMNNPATKGAPLASASATPGLDAFHQMNPEQMGLPATRATDPAMTSWLKAKPVASASLPAGGLAARSKAMTQAIFS